MIKSTIKRYRLVEGRLVYHRTERIEYPDLEPVPGFDRILKEEFGGACRDANDYEGAEDDE